MSAPLHLAAAEPSDAQLVMRVLSGDTNAYASLVHRHQEAIYRHARGMGLDHDVSLDLVQEAFVKAFDRLGDCRDGANYRSWLFRICRNLCLDELRSVRRLHVPMSAIEGVADIEDPRTAPPDLELTVRAALGQLPDALREAFLLKHDAGYTYDEIAAITGASPSAVKMRVHRAREALRSFLSHQGIGGATWSVVAGDEAGDNRGGVTRLRGNASDDDRTIVA